MNEKIEEKLQQTQKDFKVMSRQQLNFLTITMMQGMFIESLIKHFQLTAEPCVVNRMSALVPAIHIKQARGAGRLPLLEEVTIVVIGRNFL